MRIATETTVNSQKPENCIRIMGKNIVYYNSAPIMGGTCTCSMKFGGENKAFGRLANVLASAASAAGSALDDFNRQKLLTNDFFFSRGTAVCALCTSQ